MQPYVHLHEGDGVNNANFRKPAIDRNYASTWTRPQHAFVGPGAFQPGRIGNAKLDSHLVPTR